MLNPLHRAGPQRSLDLMVRQPRPQTSNFSLFQTEDPTHRQVPVSPIPDATTLTRQNFGPAAPTPKLTGDAAVVQSLKDALTAAGINFDSLGLTAHQDVVSYPGGSYVNKYISVQTNGHEEGLMTDLVAMNPKIAVLDIKHMLSHG